MKFDVLHLWRLGDPSNSGQGFQDFTCGAQGRDSTLDNAMSQPEAFGLTRVEAAVHVQEVLAVVDTWREHFGACGVTAADIAQLAEHIDGEVLLAQRRAFDATAHADVAARRPRRGPFGRR